jgi:hypothetical protein
MSYTPHLKVKPEILVEAAVEALDEKLVVSNTVTKRADAKTFYAAEGDTISQRVKGSVPVRYYAPRNDRSEPIKTDTYSETVVNITISQDRPYSAIKLTDEQKDWDFQDGWGDIVDAQTSAIGEHLELKVLDLIKNAPYERTILIDDSDTAWTAAQKRGYDLFFNAVVEAKTSLRKLRSPDTRFTCVVGLALADLLVKSNKLVKNQGTGDSALANDSIGTIAGVNFVPSVHIAEDVAYMYGASGYLVYTGVASIPNSVPFGASANANGWALRWLMDYDTGYLTDRSVFDTYFGTAYTRDRLKLYDAQGIGHVGTEEFFVRGIRLGLKGGTFGSTEQKPGDGGTGTPGGSATSWLAKAWNHTGVTVTVPEGELWPLGGNEMAPADHTHEP